jgi:hypothetical protein
LLPCRLCYHFAQEQNGWRLILADAERPECSPDPIVSTYIKRTDAQRDLMQQAVDGRLKGMVAVPLAQWQRRRERVLRLYATQ